MGNMDLMYPKPKRRRKRFDSNHLSQLYIDWLRQFPCVVCMNPSVEASHTDAVGTGRNRKRPMKEHFLVLPKCHTHHMEYEHMLLREFEAHNSIDVWKMVANMEAEFLWQLSNGKLNHILDKMTKYEE